MPVVNQRVAPIKAGPANHAKQMGAGQKHFFEK